MKDTRVVQDFNVGTNLKRLREQQGLKQHEVAARLQVMGLPVSREIYAQIETGRHSIKVSVLHGLMEIFHASSDEILAPEALGGSRGR